MVRSRTLAGPAQTRSSYDPITFCRALSSLTGPQTNPVSSEIARLHGDVVFGFTGGTGGANSTVEVDNIEVFDLCTEERDSVVIDGDLSGHGPLDLTAVGLGADGESGSYTWRVSGDLEILGPSDDRTVMVGSTKLFDGAGIVEATFSDGVCSDYARTAVAVLIFGPDIFLVPGDANLDGVVNVSDPVAELNYLFGGATLAGCLLAEDGTVNEGGLILLDHNGDGQFNIADPVGSLNRLFADGPPHVGGEGCTLIGVCRPTCTL